MAHIERRGKTYRAVWRDGGRGSPRHVSSWYGKKHLAEEHRDRVIAAKQAAKPLRPGTLLTWEALVDRYVKNRAKTTQAHRDKVRRTLLALGEEKSWKDSGGPDPASVEGVKSHGLRFLGALLRYAQGLGQPVDPRVLTLRPEGSRNRAEELLTQRHIDLLLRAVARRRPHLAEMARLIANYGHRAESLISLTGAALTKEGIVLRVKSGDMHAHPITAETRRRLEKAGKGLLFPGPKGKAWSSGQEAASAWSKLIPWYLRFKSKRRPGILDLRRYAISRMFAAGHDAPAVSSITGHRTVSLLLNTYARATKARQAAVIDQLNADEILATWEAADAIEAEVAPGDTEKPLW